MPKNLTIQPEGNLPVTGGRERGTSIAFRCRKAWAIFLAVTVSWAAGPVVHAQINPTFLQQLAAIHAERQSRTPAQKKIHSQLLFASREAAGLVPVPGAEKLHSSLRAESDGRYRVKIMATVTPELLTAIHTMGGTVLNSYPEYRAVYALMPPSKLKTLSARADVVFIGVPSGRSLNGASTPTAVETTVNDPEGDVAHAANIARTAYGVTGAGIKVGVLSDNLNDTLNIYGTALNDGYVTPVTVPPGQAGPTSEDGEGLAMLEVVHRIAPGATLYFATADPTEEQMAANIKALKADGCQIICDDISYFDESPFQDGIIAQAVDAVTAGGALYFSCAANYGNLDSGNASCWEGNFVGTADYPNVIDFDSVVGDADGAISYNSVNSENSTVVVDLFWPEPAGHATSQYDLYEINAQYQVVQEADDAVATTGQPTQELLNVKTGDTIGVEFESGSHEFLHLQIDTQNSFFGIATAGRVGGHNAMDAPNSFSVAATPAGKSFGTDDVNEEAPTGPYYGPAPKQFTASSMVEPFSDDGPRRMFFTAAGAAFTPGNSTATGGKVFAKPDFTAADGVSTSDNDPNFGQPFFGTSCATPHAAALAALALSYNPTLTPSQVAAILRGPGCVKLSEPGPGNRDAGAGILMATKILAAVAAQSAPVVTSFTPASGPVGTSVTVTGSNFLNARVPRVRRRRICLRHAECHPYLYHRAPRRRDGRSEDHQPLRQCLDENRVHGHQHDHHIYRDAHRRRKWSYLSERGENGDQRRQHHLHGNAELRICRVPLAAEWGGRAERRDDLYTQQRQRERLGPGHFHRGLRAGADAEPGSRFHLCLLDRHIQVERRHRGGELRSLCRHHPGGVRYLQRRHPSHQHAIRNRDWHPDQRQHDLCYPLELHLRFLAGHPLHLYRLETYSHLHRDAERRGGRSHLTKRRAEGEQRRQRHLHRHAGSRF